MAKTPVLMMRTMRVATKAYVHLLETEDDGFSVMNYALLSRLVKDIEV